MFPILHKGLTILSSFTPPRNSYQALDLPASGRVSVGVLISLRLPPEELQCGVETIEGGRENVRRVMILSDGRDRWTLRSAGSAPATEESGPWNIGCQKKEYNFIQDAIFFPDSSTQMASRRIGG